MGRKKAKRKAEGPKPLISAARTAPKFTSMVPVRFEPDVLDEVRRQAAADGRSVSAWIRRAVEAELLRGAAGDRSTDALALGYARREIRAADVRRARDAL